MHLGNERTSQSHDEFNEPVAIQPDPLQPSPSATHKPLFTKGQRHPPDTSISGDSEVAPKVTAPTHSRSKACQVSASTISNEDGACAQAQAPSSTGESTSLDAPASPLRADVVQLPYKANSQSPEAFGLWLSSILSASHDSSVLVDQTHGSPSTPPASDVCTRDSDYSCFSSAPIPDEPLSKASANAAEAVNSDHSHHPHSPRVVEPPDDERECLESMPRAQTEVESPRGRLNNYPTRRETPNISTDVYYSGGEDALRTPPHVAFERVRHKLLPDVQFEMKGEDAERSSAACSVPPTVRVGTRQSNEMRSSLRPVAPCCQYIYQQGWHDLFSFELDKEKHAIVTVLLECRNEQFNSDFYFQELAGGQRNEDGENKAFCVFLLSGANNEVLGGM